MSDYAAVGYRESEENIGVVNLLRLLEPGDELIMPDRKRPLTVTELSARAGKTYESGGMWDPYASWSVEGVRGGTYFVANWWSADDAGNLKRDTPNFYSTGNWESQGKPEEIELFANNADKVYELAASGPSDQATFADELKAVVYERPGYDRPLVGRCVDAEFGQPIVERILPFDRNSDPLNEAVDPSSIIAYRREGQ